MKGTRTFIFGVLLILIGGMESTEFTTFIADNPGPFAGFTGLAVIVLRMITTSPAFKFGAGSKSIAILLCASLVFGVAGCATTMTKAITEEGDILRTTKFAFGGSKILNSDSNALMRINDAGDWQMSTGDSVEGMSAESTLIQYLIQALVSAPAPVP